MKPVIFPLFLMIGILLSGGAMAANVDFSDSSLIKMGEKLSVTCQRCHGVNGLSRESIRPNLAGQSPEYLRNQLIAFRKSFRIEKLGLAGAANVKVQRRHPEMSERAGRLTDPQIDALAAYFGSLACGNDFADKVSVAPQMATRCNQCHDKKGKDHQTFMPILAGQNRDYLISQLVHLREGTFVPKIIGRNVERHHRIMTAQAVTLTNQDIAQLSAYYAASPCVTHD